MDNIEIGLSIHVLVKRYALILVKSITIQYFYFFGFKQFITFFILFKVGFNLFVWSFCI